MKKILYILLGLFVIFLISFFIIQKKYIKNSKQNYTNTIKQEIKILINTKKQNTLEIAKNIAIEKHLINIIKNNNYDLLYKKHFFSIADDYKEFKNVGIHIIDTKGFQKYISWSKKGIGQNILKLRPDLKKFLKNPKPEVIIHSGLFDIAFKAKVPIFDNNHKLLSILEITTHFNSIIKHLETQHIYSALILTKQNSSKIKFKKFGQFINNYFISNINLNPKIIPYLKQNIKKYISISPDKFECSGKDTNYFVINIPITNNGKVLGYFVSFIEDRYNLKEKEMFLNIIMAIITILFIMVGYIAYKNMKKNENLIKNLHTEVEKQISEKLNLIYIDSLTKAYKKSKFEIDKIHFLDYDVVMLNIKNFSKINEFYGFHIGDKVLKIVVQRIEKLLNSKIYRINADEFVFFSKATQKDIKNIKQLFITNPIQILKENIKIRLSFSFSVVKNEGNEVLRKLAIALKESKQKPFNDFIYYKEKPIQNDFIKFNSILYDAIFIHKRAEIIPYFQGIRNNKEGIIKKYECLARLENNKIYSPFYFLEIAKNSGFLFEITKIMIDSSLKYISTKDENIEISINITEDDLLTSQLKDYLLEKTQKYNVSPNRITLEILEGITSNGTKNNISQLKELKKLGFKLAIDDFGVEYSNFERISELDIDFIKIDGKYIKTLNTNPKSYKIAKAITDFAHSLNIKVVAEFVENEDLQKLIDKLNIEYSQGYYFSKPKESI